MLLLRQKLPYSELRSYALPSGFCDRFLSFAGAAALCELVDLPQAGANGIIPSPETALSDCSGDRNRLLASRSSLCLFGNADKL